MKIKVKSDLTVIGAGYAGIVAAISAARLGLKVALINDRDVPGGNASSENRIHVNGGASCNKSYYSRESGIADELKLTTLQFNPRYNKKEEYHLSDMALFQMIINEENISYYPSTAAYDCEVEDGKVVRVFAFCPKNFEEYVFESDNFCDASGDGIVAEKAGAEYRLGREAKSEFNESLAPDEADDKVMGSCILFTTKESDAPVTFKKPPFAYDFEKDDKLKYFDRPETGRELPKKEGPYGGMWWLEYGGECDPVKNAKHIDLELRKLIYGYWDYIKNSGKFTNAEKSEIVWIAPHASKREAKRFMSDYILTQNDIMQEKQFEDAVSTGGWSLDIHDVGGIYGKEYTSAFGEVNSMYNIPYSIMYSKNINNLFLAGRIISCTHVAFGSIRVMQTLGAMGQAVGTAAYLCKKYNATPRDVRTEHIAELQDTLQKNGQYIMFRKEDCGVAADAKITASSTAKIENDKPTDFVSLSKGAVYALPNKSGIKSVEVLLKNDSNSDIVADFSVLESKSNTNYLFGDEVSRGNVTIPASFEGFVKLDVNYSGSSEKIFVKVCNNDKLMMGVSKERVTGAPTFNSDGSYTAYDGAPLSYCFKNVACDEDWYSADNVINGYSRPFNVPNCWVSDSNNNEWLELSFNDAKDINEIQIYFNPQFESEHFDNPIEQLVTDYKMTVVHNDGVYETVVKDNYLSINSHKLSLKGVSQIRFDFIGNNGAKGIEVFAVKAF